MITVALTPASIGATRFAISPLIEASAALVLLRRPQPRAAHPWAKRAAAVLTSGRFPLLDALNRTAGWVPDLLNPEPDGFEADLSAELHQVAVTHPSRVQAEVAHALAGRPDSGVPPARFARTVTALLDRGEDRFCQRAADELDRFWHELIAPRWSLLRRRLDDDVEHRGRIATRDGVAHMWTTLSRRLHWRDGGLAIDSPYRVVAPGENGILLLPSAVIDDLAVGVDPIQLRRTFLVYPARAADAPVFGPGAPVEGVLGRTRSALLASLEHSMTTSELARRHQLSPATVSYHLTRMYRAGLVSRRRAGREVRYLASDRGRTLRIDAC